MARRRVVISGLGTVCGLGVGIEALWTGLMAGRSAAGRIQAFDASGFDAQIAAETIGIDVRQHVPKSYRKATKVMCRDIELAVIAADQAVRDAGLMTPSVDASVPPTYPSSRLGANIGAGLITADLEELTSAFAESTDDHRQFDIHRWGSTGMTHLTPLWLLKYLPNMLACHVTIVHDAQGPSNTLTCCETSGGLSVAESMRIIERGAADVCFSGGAESKIHPMTFYRQMAAGRLSTTSNENPAAAAKPFDRHADGTLAGEGGGLLMLEARETALARGARIYAEMAGYGAGQGAKLQREGLEPETDGRGIAVAMRAALRDAGLQPQQIDLVVTFGSGIAAYDRAEAAALKSVFGTHLPKLPLWSSKPFIGTCGAGVGGLDAAIAARMLFEGAIPPRINCSEPLEGLDAANCPARKADLKHVMIVTVGMGGQNVALVFKKAED